ncbi:MAG: polysaccharide deacetylase family protein [Proteobacteria bacterium]|nr:polysaccharide deacetylase family protein [Pseudomonadota bacterium]
MAAGATIGAHGQTHAPLTTVDARAQLTTSRAVLERHLGDGAAVTTLSFPHGRFDDDVVATARAAGYRLMFTSERELPTVAGTGDVLGRVGIFHAEIVDHDGRFAPEQLALGLFRQPHGR